MIGAGEYEYFLQYRTHRQVGFFKDFDELYWNVTGNGWAFPIDRASAEISLPQASQATDLRTAFYTGRQGEVGQDAVVTVSSNGRSAEFHTTRALGPGEGLTVALGWPKGIVQEPGAGQKLTWFLNDNKAALVMGLGLLIPFGWYLWAWNRVGRDPVKGVIIPRFETTHRPVHRPLAATCWTCHWTRPVLLPPWSAWA